MLTASVMEKMIACSKGNLHDIDHFLKVWALAKTIGEQEGLDAHTQELLELAAIVHDIACPLCREKYGDTNGKHQERESPPLVESFFAPLPVDPADVERISWVVGHHHTYHDMDGMDYQILIEADYLVNASEKTYSPANVQNFMNTSMKTESGKKLAKALFCL